MRKLIVLLLVSYLTANSFGQQINLLGVLKTDAGVAVPKTPISVAGGQGIKTDRSGQFKIILSNDFKEGERVIIKVSKPNWVINYPLDGEWNLPNLQLQNLQPLHVIIVPKGSKALWTNARIEKYIAKLSDELAKVKREGDKPLPVNFSVYINQWAKEYGFTPEEVKASFDEWARAVENAEDYKTIGLREFYKKNFAVAAASFDKAAEKSAEQVKQDQKRLSKDKLEAYEIFKLAGNTRSNLYEFREALQRYVRAESYITQKDNPEKWAEIKNLMGNAKAELGSRVLGFESRLLLAEAVISYRSALEVRTKDRFPEGWASSQSNLANALSNKGKLQGVTQGKQAFTDAILAYREALKVYTLERFQQDWARVQHNLGETLMSLGVQMTGETSMKLLDEAVSAYRAALRVRTQADFPQQWAATQNNLGVALMSKGQLISKGSLQLLEEAVTAYRAALQVRTRERFPQAWARTQNNLCSALSLMGERLGGTEGRQRVEESVSAYKEILEVFTRERFPQQWAGTQNNIGMVLVSQASREGINRKNLLERAIVAYSAALEVRTREHMPQAWAETQDNLARALGVARNWGEAIRICEAILEFNPQFQKAHQSLTSIYQLGTFEYKKAYELHQKWIARFPSDTTVLPDFVETHFTTGNFLGFAEQIRPLLTRSEIDGNIKIALQMIAIANIVGLENNAQIFPALTSLRRAITEQQPDLQITWSFTGIIHFINGNEKFNKRRGWLNQLFGIAEEKNRDAILKALDEVIARYMP